ncbi:hypothetical protein MANAM107_14600 [Actinomyces capricornis]|uniref:LppM domain-containing protein n=2 Tax=Actinomyces capricornis TaxID=2755559 RepID=A0ABN6K6R3_9ACTO|nr:hypothetical protein MANAM107_14600 [Actinomyces capricornis]
MLALVLLSACGVEYDVVIHDDDTVDLTYTVWDSSGLELITEETCTQETMSSYSSPLPPGTRTTYTYTTHGKSPACEISGSAIPLSELDDQGTAWSVAHEGREYVFSLSPSALSQAGGAEAAAGMTANVSVTFPGQVSSANGEIDGSTVTWRGVTSSSERLEARGHDGSVFSVTVASVVVTALVLLMTALTVVSIMANRRRKRAERTALRHLMQEQAPSAPSASGASPSSVYPLTAPAPQGQYPPVASAPASAGYSQFLQPGQPPTTGDSPGLPEAAMGAGSAQVPLDEPYPQSPTPGYISPSPAGPYQPVQHTPPGPGADGAFRDKAPSVYQVPPPAQAGHMPQAPLPYSDPHSEPYRPPDVPGQYN